ncbi:hypothetical protein JCM10207_000514 [Rhodosporidiobolus poonsookiae]
MRSLLPLLLSGFAAASPVLFARNNAPTVTISNGTIEGVLLSTFNQDAFLGIPYAQKPLGNLRLRRPRVLEQQYEGGVHEAKEYPKFCVGGANAYDNFPYKESEDCLYLNVVRPASTKEGDALPVGFWIHGGGFSMGGSGDMRYNSSWLIERSVEMEKPIIFVSINYRTAALGLMTSTSMKEVGEQNFGLYDQRLALQWVNENIAAFGGDPSKVTIWGESAGASSVGYHLLGYGLTESPLFRGGILESGSPGLFQPKPTSSYDESFASFLEDTGCDSIDCVRGLSLETFNSTATKYRWGIVIDGQLVPKSPTEQVRNGEFVPAALLIGTNTDEGASFGASGINTTADLTSYLYGSYPTLSNSTVDTLLSAYPDDPSLGCPFETGDLVLPSGLQDKRAKAMAGDFSMHAGRRRLSQAMAEKDVPVYSYRFNQPAQNSTVLQGVLHFVEVAYVFSVPNEYKTANTLGNRPGDAELAKLTTSQWVSFIHDLDPNNHGIENVPEWPDYRTAPSNFVATRHGSTVEADDYRADGIAAMLAAAN